MSHLFQAKIAELKKTSKLKELDILDKEAQTETQELLKAHPHNKAYKFPDDRAVALTANIGAKNRRDRMDTTSRLTKAGGGGDAQAHATDYVGGDTWNQVSNNAQEIHGRAAAELESAYKLGLDIRSPVVIGAIYKLAVRVWSLGLYTSADQDTGRR